MLNVVKGGQMVYQTVQWTRLSDSELGCHNPVSVLGRDEGYTVKYNPLPEGVPEETPEGKGLYLTIYPELSPNTDIISF